MGKLDGVEFCCEGLRCGIGDPGLVTTEVGARLYAFSGSFKRGESKEEEGNGFDEVLELPWGRDADLGGTMTGDRDASLE